MGWNYREWNAAQWGEWLSLREKILATYITSMKPYVNLPAADHLAVRDVQKKVEPVEFQLAYEVVAPPENRLLHNWRDKDRRQLDWELGLDMPDDLQDEGLLDDGDFIPEEFFTPEELEEMEAMEAMGGDNPTLDGGEITVPDDIRIYRLLDKVVNQIRRYNEAADICSGLLARAIMSDEDKAFTLALNIMLELSQSLFCVESTRDAICSYDSEKGRALFRHARKKMMNVLNFIKEENIRRYISPVLARKLEELTAELLVLEKSMDAPMP